MNQSNQSKQVLLSVIGVAILVVAVVGVSFAFFNYTRTGSANTIKTGTIMFNATETTMTIENMFPTTKATAQNASETQAGVVGVATVTITGKTNYTPGIDYEITADSVTGLGQGDGKLPVSLIVTEDSNTTGLGTHTVNSFNTVAGEAHLTEGAVLASGHINGDNSEVNHVITIKAYIDADRVAISDTLAPGVSDNDGGSDAGRIEVDGYTNGTTSTWVAGRTVLTTSEWNALNSTAGSFKIKVVANETAS